MRTWLLLCSKVALRHTQHSWRCPNAFSVLEAQNVLFCNVQLMMAAETAEEGRTLLGALEIGVDGVVMCTDNLPEVLSLPFHVPTSQLLP